MHELQATLETHTKSAEQETARLREEIRKRNEILKLVECGIDSDKVALAESVIYAGNYAVGGADRASCVADAVRQLSTGKPISPYSDLWSSYLGTKNYDRWSGQRSDHSYGCGPRHGWICFEIGLHNEVRNRTPRELTAEEIEAAIYFLLNVERIQKAKQMAATPVMA